MKFGEFVKGPAHDRLEEIRTLANKYPDAPVFPAIFQLVRDAFDAGREPEECELYHDCSDCPADYCWERDGEAKKP
ncbi:MAG: hypothetical protein DRN30_03180 [Thermoplasmata archaeon]|nr:MAG: hypothetical protein DRN30_03180 [Thermoplasmata archaeon]